jgi:hypothetical protein
MDYLIPLAASREEFVPIQQVALVLVRLAPGSSLTVVWS